MKKLLAILLIQVMPLMAQTEYRAGSAGAVSLKEPATANESFDGKTYKFMFTDPNNEWRCYATSLFPVDDVNIPPSAVTIVCVKSHVVVATPKAEMERGK